MLWCLPYTLNKQYGTLAFTFTCYVSSWSAQIMSHSSFYSQTSGMGCNTWIEIDLKWISTMFLFKRKTPKLNSKTFTLGALQSYTHLFFPVHLPSNWNIFILVGTLELDTELILFHAQVWGKCSLAVHGTTQVRSIGVLLACEMMARTVIWKTFWIAPCKNTLQLLYRNISGMQKNEMKVSSAFL